MCRWRDRFAVALAIGAIALLHRAVFGAVENSPAGMLWYHGGAALFDGATIVIAAHALQGQLSYDMQRLGICAMIVNFMGWLAYLAYLPPAPYNAAIVALSYVQWVRLLWIGRHDANHLGRDLVRWDHSGGTKLHFTEAHK